MPQIPLSLPSTCPRAKRRNVFCPQIFGESCQVTGLERSLDSSKTFGKTAKSARHATNLTAPLKDPDSALCTDFLTRSKPPCVRPPKLGLTASDSRSSSLRQAQDRPFGNTLLRQAQDRLVGKTGSPRNSVMFAPRRPFSGDQSKNSLKFQLLIQSDPGF